MMLPCEEFYYYEPDNANNKPFLKLHLCRSTSISVREFIEIMANLDLTICNDCCLITCME